MLKQTLLTGWHFMRWFRLIIGIIIGVQAIQMHHPISGFIAAFFIFQALSNTGCCGTNQCSTPTGPANAQKIEDIAFEEVTVSKAKKLS
jgi:hypothetical protein